MLPIALGAASAGLGVLGGIAGNNAIEKQAKATYESNKLFIERDAAVAANDLLIAGRDVGSAMGMALTELGFAQRSASATLAANTIEREAYGATAAKLQQTTAIKAELSRDSVVQRAEAKMEQVNTQLRSNYYKEQSQQLQNIQAYNNSMSQRSSFLELASGAIGDFAGGFSMGTAIESSMAAVDFAKTTTDSLSTELGAAQFELSGLNLSLDRLAVYGGK